MFLFFFLDMFFLDLCHEIDWKFKVSFIVFGQGAKQNANIPNFEFFFLQIQQLILHFHLNP